MIGLFPSLKMGRMVAFESLIEQDYLYVLDYEAAVTSFEEQPLTIEYVCEGALCKYTPDFLVRRNESSELVECKPAPLVSKEENRRKFAAATDWCKTKGWSFAIVTDQDLRNGPRLANIKLLTQYARLGITSETVYWVECCLVGANNPLTLKDGGQILYPHNPAQGISILLYLAFHHQIEISLDDQPICGSSLIWKKEAPLS
jgi:hypothetical protein